MYARIFFFFNSEFSLGKDWAEVKQAERIRAVVFFISTVRFPTKIGAVHALQDRRIICCCF